MSELNTVTTALSPTNKLARLALVTSAYKPVESRFNELLIKAHLEDMAISNPSDETAPPKDLRAFVVEGHLQFQTICQSNLALARKVISYSGAIGVVLKTLTLDKFVTTMQPVTADFAKSEAERAVDSQNYFIEFEVYLGATKTEVESLDSQITSLTAKIKTASKELAELNIVQSLYNIFAKFYKLGSKADADIQLATLLRLGIDVLQGTFSDLGKGHRTQALLDALESTRKEVTSIKSALRTIYTGLDSILQDSQALLSVWKDLAANMTSIKDITRPATTDELAAVSKAWATAATNAQDFVNAVLDTAGATPVANILANKSVSGLTESSFILPADVMHNVVHHMVTEHTKMPQSDAEIRFYRMSALAKAHVPATFRAANVSEADDTNLDDNAKKFIEKAGPPADAKKQLDDLGQNTGQILGQFKALLEQPYLDQLQCINPDKPSEQTTLQDLLTTYQKRYVELQLKTIPVARNLKSYAAAQLALLPLLIKDDDIKDRNPGQITVTEYQTVNEKITEQYRAASEELFSEHLRFSNQWDNVINAVQQSSNTCTANIDAWTKSVDQMSDEKKKATLYGSLEIAGAVLCFAVSALIPGGLLVSGALIGGLIYEAVSELQKAHQLDLAINDLKGKINIQVETKKQLEAIIPTMKAVSGLLKAVVNIWSDIVQALTDVTTYNTILAVGMLDIAMPQLKDQWNKVSASCESYIKIVNDN